MKNVEDIYPLSPLQESLLAHCLATPGSRVGFEQVSCVLEGRLDVVAFESAWRQLVESHAIFRTAFLADGLEKPVQVVRRRVELPFEHGDWSAFGEVEREARLEAYLEGDLGAGFDPAKAPLMRLALFRLAEERHQLVWSHHHLLLDGWCKALVIRDVLTLYESLRQGLEPRLPGRPPYKRFIAWLQARDEAATETFWRRAFEGMQESGTRLGIDLLPGTRATGGQATAARALPASVDHGLGELGGRYGLTRSTLVQAAWALLLSRYSERRDVVFGTVVSGRPAELPGAEAMIGMFINNLPVPVRVDEAAVVASWLERLQGQLAELRRHEHSSPAQVEHWSGRRGGRLFDTLVLYQSYPTAAGAGGRSGASGSLVISGYRSRLETNFPLTFVAVPRRPPVLKVHYDARRFEPASIERLLAHVVALLEGLAADAGRRVGELPLLGAAELHQVLVERNDPLPPGALPSLLEGARRILGEPEAGRASRLQGTPSEWLCLLAEGFRSRPEMTLISWGEPLSGALARRLTEGGAELWNLYGGTEIGGWHALRRVRRGEALIAIGRPIAGCRLYVLDRRLRPVPTGVAGWIFVALEAPARIAVDEARQVAARVCPDPFSSHPGGRLLVTGDRGRLLADGGVEPLGHGAHTEEVEAVLRRHPEILGVSLSAGDARHGGIERSQAVAYLFGSSSAPPAVQLRRWLARWRLEPAPTRYVALEVPPLAADGKLDRHALPAAESSAQPSGEAIASPRDPLELQLLEIWERLFDRRPLGVDEDFFELGGTSLMAVRLVAEIRSRLGLELPMRAVLEGATVAGIARRLRGEGGAAGPWSPLVTLQPSGARPGLFLVHPAGGSILRFVDLAYHLGGDRPVYGLQARGLEAGQEPLHRIEEMAELYLEAVRAAQPEGPYHLGGWSFGGLVAYEMARRCRRSGAEVGLLGLLDTAAGAEAWEGVATEHAAGDHAARLARLLGDEMPVPVEELRRIEGRRAQVSFLVEKAKVEGALPADFDEAQAQRFFAVIEAHSQALRGYRPEPSELAIDLFVAERGVVTLLEDPTLGWSRLSPEKVRMHRVSGDHRSFVRRPFVASLARELRAALEHLESLEEGHRAPPADHS